MIDIAALSVHDVSSSTILIDRANEKKTRSKAKVHVQVGIICQSKYYPIDSFFVI